MPESHDPLDAIRRALVLLLNCHGSSVRATDAEIAAAVAALERELSPPPPAD